MNRTVDINDILTIFIAATPEEKNSILYQALIRIPSDLTLETFLAELIQEVKVS